MSDYHTNSILSRFIFASILQLPTTKSRRKKYFKKEFIPFCSTLRVKTPKKGCSSILCRVFLSNDGSVHKLIHYKK